MRLKVLTLFACALLGLMHAVLAAAADADVWLRSAFVNWRVQHSVSDITMTVHHENWLRSMQMSAWLCANGEALAMLKQTRER